MGETLAEAPLVETAPPGSGGLILDKVDWDYSHLRPEPGFIAEASAALEAPVAEAAPVSAATAQELSPEPVQPGSLAAEAASDSSVEPEIILDAAGNQWQDLGATETGMHKIYNPAENHTKFITEESFNTFKPAGQEAEPPAVVATAPETTGNPLPSPEVDPDPEKEQLREVIEKLTTEIGRLEVRVATLESAGASEQENSALIVGGDSRKVYGPEDEIDAFIRKSREDNLARLEKLNSSPSARFHGAWERARKSLIENAKRSPAAIAGGSADIAKGTVQSASPYIKRAVEPFGVGMMYGQVLAENGPRLAGEAGRKAIEVVSEAGQKAVEASKEPLGVGVAMAQVAGEKTAQAARDSLSQGMVAAKMTAENINSGLESARSYRRRRICGVVGAGVMMWSVIFGPIRVEARPEDAAGSKTSNEKIDTPSAAAL